MFRKQRKVQSFYDVVIIGNGLEGLSAALECARLGSRPLLLAHNHPSARLLHEKRCGSVDNQRAMPGETGVIDIAAFLGELDSIGYDGPITAEPFSQELNAMDDEAGARATVASLDRIFATAGIA